MGLIEAMCVSLLTAGPHSYSIYVSVGRSPHDVTFWQRGQWTGMRSFHCQFTQYENGDDEKENVHSSCRPPKRSAAHQKADHCRKITCMNLIFTSKSNQSNSTSVLPYSQSSVFSPQTHSTHSRSHSHSPPDPSLIFPVLRLSYCSPTSDHTRSSY